MLLVSVLSTNLSAMGYDEMTGELQVQFVHGGEIYSYQNVPPEVYFGLLNAPSKGTFFAYNIRNNSAYLPVRIF